jgi:adenine-specific DNA-methyltransferase
VRQRLGGRKLRFLDIFAGTGIVSRSMKRHSSLVIANDLEAYSRVTSQCYLANAGDLDLAQIAEACASIDACARENEQGGFIRELYAPRDDGDIRRGERVFYTVRNAALPRRRASGHRRFPQRLHPFLLAPLLSEASVHVNTSGVFKGFYKDGAVGRFGGRGGNALPRILGEIRLEAPVLSRHRVRVHRPSGGRERAGSDAAGGGSRVSGPSLQPASLRLELLFTEPARRLRPPRGAESRLGNPEGLEAVPPTTSGGNRRRRSLPWSNPSGRSIA